MKKLIFTIAVALAALSTFPVNAQKSSLLGTKRSIVSVAVDNDNEFEIFSFDKDGDRDYYMGIGTDAKEDIFLFLGNTSAEAVAGMEKIAEMFSAKEGTVREFPARLGTNLPLEGMKTVKVSAEKKGVTRKIQLRFTYKAEKGTVESVMQQNTSKTLVKFINSYNQRHPDR